MSEEQKEQPRTNYKQIVQGLIKAKYSAENADGYKAICAPHTRTTTIYFNNGKNAMSDHVLAQYIQKAEADFIQSKSGEILKLAEEMLENEIESIREIVNGD